MTKFTKADIDGLVEGLVQNGALEPTSANGFASDCYLAAGLTTKGEPKPEKVRMTLLVHDDGTPFFGAIHDHPDWSGPKIPGTFIPDGPE